MDLAELRREYAREGLHREALAADPFAQFERWFEQARQAELDEPNAFCLATAGADGRPSTRTVLLKDFSERGFIFYTNYESRKAREIDENPRAAANFLWLPLQRQVNVAGTVERVSRAESLRYFLSRPFGSRLGAWSSPQSQVISSRRVVEMKLDEMKRKYADGEVPLPGFWGGYRIVPETVEFWQGRPNRLHDRFQYRRGHNGEHPWVAERLAP